MLRALIIATLLTSSSAFAAQAQTAGGPPIAYVKTGAWSEIYLVNPNGSGPIRIYRTRGQLGAIDLKPGGGEISFVESWLLRTLTFDSAGRQTGLSAPRGFNCPNAAQADGLDYHPGGGPTLVADGCGHIWTLATPTSAPQLQIGSSVMLTHPRWLPDGSGFVYTSGGGGNPVQFWRETYPVSGSPTLLGNLTELPMVNMKNTGNTAVLVYLDRYEVWDLDASSQTTGCHADARNIQFSPTDAQAVYRTRGGKGGEFILLKNANCSGNVTTVAPKSNYSVEIDWRK